MSTSARTLLRYLSSRMWASALQCASSWRVSRCSRRRQTTAFHNGDQAVHADVSHGVHAAADPLHLNLVNLIALAQAEMEPLSKVALITAPAVDLVDLHQVTGRDLHPRADAVAIGFRATKLDLNPM